MKAKVLGTLTDVIETGANDVYAVKTPEGKEILLPAIRDCIPGCKCGRKTDDRTCDGRTAGLMNFHVLTLFPEMIRTDLRQVLPDVRWRRGC